MTLQSALAYDVLGEESLPVSTSAVGFASTIGGNFVYAQCEIITGGPMYANDNSAPVVGGGAGDELFALNQKFRVTGQKSMNNVQFILKTSGTAVTLSIRFYGTSGA